MTNPEWLPSLLLLSDFGGDWDLYLDEIYARFNQDFVSTKPKFEGRRFGLKAHPRMHGKEATFWHMIQQGQVEAERIPDLRRCERIGWPRAIIENASDHRVKVWRAERGRELRINLWLASESYLVVLADRRDFVLPWTAYLVNRDHTRRKLLKEYDEYRKNHEDKG